VKPGETDVDSPTHSALIFNLVSVDSGKPLLILFYHQIVSLLLLTESRIFTKIYINNKFSKT